VGKKEKRERKLELRAAKSSRGGEEKKCVPLENKEMEKCRWAWDAVIGEAHGPGESPSFIKRKTQETRQKLKRRGEEHNGAYATCRNAYLRPRHMKDHGGGQKDGKKKT